MVRRERETETYVLLHTHLYYFVHKCTLCTCLYFSLFRQWLHPTKLDSLGISKDFDHSQLGASGASKRSVQQAYERAMRYHRKVIQSSHLIDDESDCSSST